MLLLSKLLLAATLVSVVISVPPILVAGYNVGVEAGDWIVYDVVGDVPAVAQYDWVKLEFQGVSGTEVTALLTAHRKDGQEETNPRTFDIETVAEPWLIPAGLRKDDVFPFDYGSAVLNDTVTRIYAGATRTVNVLDLPNYQDYMEMTVYWDQETGVLVELLVSMSSPDESWGGGYKAKETNMWSATLQATVELSSETVSHGDIVTVSADVMDLSENLIEGATVTASVDDNVVSLADMGGGHYAGDFDTGNLEPGTWSMVVVAEKGGYDPAQVPVTLTVEMRILHVTLQLSTDTATQGDAVTISAVVQDLAENPIEGATVTVAIGGSTMSLSDQGNGNYQTTVDTSVLSVGTHAVTVTAEKEWCEPGQNSETLTIGAPTPWTLYGGIAAIVVGIAAVALYLVKRRS